MIRKICLLNAHPDPSPERFCSALTDAYEEAALETGCRVSRFNLGELELPPLDRAEDFLTPPAPMLEPMREAMRDADHVTMIFPLWLGGLPAKSRIVLEHLARAGFFVDQEMEGAGWSAQKMRGKSARLIVTIGMPGAAYKLLFGAHSLKGLESGMFRISGFGPVRHSVFGLVESGPQRRARMLKAVRKLGRLAS